MVDVDVRFSSEVLLRLEVSTLGTLGGGIISTSSGVELKGSVWYGVSESALPDCRPLVDVIPPVLAESLSMLAELLVVWVPAYSVVQSVSAPEVGGATQTITKHWPITHTSVLFCTMVLLAHFCKTPQMMINE